MYKGKIWYIKNSSGCIWTREDYGGVMTAPFFRNSSAAKKFIRDWVKEAGGETIHDFKVCSLPCTYDVDIA